MKERQCFVCDYCGSKYLTKRLCEKHEKICKHNPMNFYPCHYCEHFMKYSIFSEPDYSGGFTWNFIPSYCKAKKQYMQTAKAFIKNKGNPIVNDYKKTFSQEYSEPLIQYPCDCDIFTQKDSFFTDRAFNRFIKRFPSLKNKVKLWTIEDVGEKMPF